MPSALRHHTAVVGSTLASTVSLWRGCLVVQPAKQPAKPLTLYEFEACPFCRLVREALTALHLDVEIRPCPRNGTRFRPEAERLGDKRQFPLLVDANTGRTMYESRDIVKYLFETYGTGAPPLYYQVNPVHWLAGGVSSALRGWRGARARASKAPAQPLALWSFEGSPYSRPVRERLCELELPYRLHNLGKEHWREAGPAARRIEHPYVPREGGKRHAFWLANGRVQLPYLEDPNTGTRSFESAEIIDYLERTYAV